MVEREYCQTSIHVLPNHPQQDQKKFLYHALHTLFNALQRRVSSRNDRAHIYAYMYEQLLCLSASLHRMTLLLYIRVSSPSLIALDRGSFKEAGVGCGWCSGPTWGTLLSNIWQTAGGSFLCVVNIYIHVGSSCMVVTIGELFVLLLLCTCQS